MKASQQAGSAPSNYEPRVGATDSPDPMKAAEILFETIHQEDSALTVVFCSTEYDLEEMNKALVSTFGDTPLIGCTSAGEITPDGYKHGTLTGFSFPGAGFTAVSAKIDSLTDFEISSGLQMTKDLIADLEAKQPKIGPGDTFAFLMIDGLSCSEEPIVSSIYSALEDIPLFGGSAGDGLNFNRTFVFHEGAFHTNSAVLTLVRTHNPFKVFKTNHLTATGKKMRLTKPDPKPPPVPKSTPNPADHKHPPLKGLAKNRRPPRSTAPTPGAVKVAGRHNRRTTKHSTRHGA